MGWTFCLTWKQTALNWNLLNHESSVQEGSSFIVSETRFECYVFSTQLTQVQWQSNKNMMKLYMYSSNAIEILSSNSISHRKKLLQLLFSIYLHVLKKQKKNVSFLFILWVMHGIFAYIEIKNLFIELKFKPIVVTTFWTYNYN